MRLENHEVKRFYTIWFPLLYHVNQKQQIIPYFPDEWGDASVDPDDAALVRNALWDDDSLLESFIAENPAGLSADDLALVTSWQHRVVGEFFIFRHLKKYTVFLSGDSPARAYGVLGLTSPFEDVIGSYLPIYVKAALIPFEGRITYDGLIAPYSISFGGGIKADLKDSYRNIQEREGVITTLIPDAEASSPENIKKDIQERNKKILSAFQKSLGQSGLSPKKIEEHTENITHFSQAFLLSLNPLVPLLDLSEANVKAYLETQPRKSSTVSFKRFMRFLRDTGRMNYYEAEEILDFVKGV